MVTGAKPSKVRSPAVAGAFYPGRERELVETLDRYLDRVPPGDDTGTARSPKAIIAPHAGYVYSGPIAATAYARWREDVATIRRVVILGPAHRVPVRSMALSSADLWRTPLGEVPIDDDLRRRVSGMRGVVVDDRAHAQEHSLEVHVPFLQHLLAPGFTMLPIVVGHARPPEIADVLDAVWGGDETRIVISTDLSHYHDYATAQELDRETASAIVSKAAMLDPGQACGAYPVQGMLEAARRHQLRVELLDLRNSGDTAGPRDRVVGYGAFTVGAA